MTYTVELWREGERGIEQTLHSTEDIGVAGAVYEAAVREYPGCIIMLCDRAMILRHSVRDVGKGPDHRDAKLHTLSGNQVSGGRGGIRTHEGA